ncbi:xanthine dehydrogenase family protein molybdopterin-binding subunit [Zwartia panacis]|jgi:CO/xanthine dehydrogenase Mo-binding subunit|uniref:xanthine dehydrogenase family protein molybdopterin-binding subunit n=1 Tax=Zwartia panacis TaxID=2683345 RepID=UPI0025B4CD58|nr:xanthine dehydrogenase family protein molybdopterin-binding subunit [Zwartia panacis]MDN4017694.1 xanthine dehydrogenase family protein molybdopterin-binding subunit [Zwartia panacis]
MLTNTKNTEQAFKSVGTSPIRPDGVPKVTGIAQYGADYSLPGMLWAKILRSPHAHARIRSINTSKAEALPGVKAVLTAADLPNQPFDYVGPERVAVNYWHMTRNILAREKALYEGHAIAAVAATTAAIAAEAISLIEVDYEILPHVIDVDEAMKPDAPLLFEDMITRGIEPAPTKPSNITKRLEFKVGDLDAGFASADEVVEMSFKTAPVHQGYIEPHSCLARFGADGQCELWSSSQGHFVVRAYTAKLLGMEIGNLVVHPAEIGGGFGGKTVVYVEPIAVALSRKTGHPVKIMMSREDVFKATGPTSGASMTVKIGVKKDGTIVAADGLFKFQAGAFPGSPVMNATMCAFAPYVIPNVRSVGFDVVCNRPKSAAYRAPGSPISAFAVESVLDVLAQKIGMDPLKLRLKNAVKAGSPTAWGPKHSHDGYAETIQALLNHPEYNKPLGKNQGRGVASGFWFNGGGESTASIHINEDGTVVLATGSMDVGGSRASMALMAAETLGVPYESVRSTVADTASIGYNHVTGGSRVTYATGLAVVEACNKIIEQLRLRASIMWDVDVKGVVWEDGFAKPADKSVGDFEPLSLKAIAAKRAVTGGPIVTEAAVNAGGQAPGFSTQFCDVEVDPETGAVKILRFVAAQDVGRAIHPKYCEGQIHGGVVQGIGWALNEEYIYDKQGRLANAGFLDYRIPVASDLPMIEAILVEVPNPNHPYGVKGVGEANIVPPMAAVANAIQRATGKRLTELPMSPPKVLAAIDAG